MADKMVFLSHIHEERALAVLVKNALEAEFSGFVDVFVSSDGSSIPAGSNFLKRIEDGLVACVGAVYLVSPSSVMRHWISFELGAVWIRNSLSVRTGGLEIPTLPMCHSGMTPASLPAPLNNLNGIVANQASQLEFAFRSLQRAVGGSGALKTNFDALAAGVISLEQEYTLGANLKRMLRLLGGNMETLVKHCEQRPSGSPTTIECGFVETEVVQSIKKFEANELKGHINVIVDSAHISFTDQGPVSGANMKISVPVDLVKRFKTQLLTP